VNSWAVYGRGSSIQVRETEAALKQLKKRHRDQFRAAFEAAGLRSSVVVEKSRSPPWKVARDAGLTSTSFDLCLKVDRKHRQRLALLEMHAQQQLAGFVQIDNHLLFGQGRADGDILHLSLQTYEECRAHLSFLDRLVHKTDEILSASFLPIKGESLEVATLAELLVAAKALGIKGLSQWRQPNPARGRGRGRGDRGRGVVVVDDPVLSSTVSRGGRGRGRGRGRGGSAAIAPPTVLAQLPPTEAAESLPSDVNTFRELVRQNRMMFNADITLLGAKLENMATKFKATRAMEAGIALEPAGLQMLRTFVQEHGELVSPNVGNLFKYVCVRCDIGLQKNVAFPSAMTTSDGLMLFSASSDSPVLSASLECKTLDSADEIARSYAFAAENGLFCRFRVSYNMEPEAKLIILEAVQNHPGYLLQCLNHAAVEGNKFTVFFTLDGKTTRRIIRAVLLEFDTEMLERHCLCSDVLSARMRPWDNNDEVVVALPEQFHKREVKAALDLSHEILAGPPVIGSHVVMKPAVIALHNILKTSQDTCKKEMKQFRPVSQGHGPIFQIFTELNALAWISALRVFRAGQVFKAAEGRTHLPADAKELQTLLNNLGSSSSLFGNMLRQNQAKLASGALKPVVLQSAAASSFSVLSTLRKEADLAPLRDLYRTALDSRRGEYDAQVEKLLLDVSRNVTGKRERFNHPLLAAHRIFDVDPPHVPTTVPKNMRRVCVLDCKVCEQQAIAGESCEHVIDKFTSQNVCTRCAEVPLCTVSRKYLGGLNEFDYFHNAPVLQDHGFHLESVVEEFSEKVTHSTRKRRRHESKAASGTQSYVDDAKRLEFDDEEEEEE